MKSLPVWLVGFLLLAPAAANAETPHHASVPLESLTQEEAVHLALEPHPKIHKAQAHVEQVRVRLTEARRWFRPRISVYAGERIDTEGHRVGIQFSHDLDELWNRSKTLEAESELAIAEQEFVLTRQAVVEEAVSAYHTWVLAREDRRHLSHSVRRSRRALTHGHQQYEEGLLSRAQLNELEQALENAQRAHQEAYAKLVQSAVRLRQAMGELGLL